jgi:hypothetical protein
LGLAQQTISLAKMFSFDPAKAIADGEGERDTYLLLDAGFESEKLLLAHVAFDVLVVGRDACTVYPSL